MDSSEFYKVWRSPQGEENAVKLRQHYAAGFHAIAEYDRIGHLLLYRVGTQKTISGADGVVGVALLRRAVTLFAGIRALFEQSIVDPAKALVRSYFELWLAFRCLAYGSIEPISLETPTDGDEREARARRYYVAAERRELLLRAIMLDPAASIPITDKAKREALEKELDENITRLKDTYPNEWKFFGDVSAKTVRKHFRGRDEPSWFTADFVGTSVRSVGQLATAFGYRWEYDFLYDSLSALVHPRGVQQDVSVADGMLEVHHPHDPHWFETLAFWATSWHGVLLMTAAKAYCPAMIEQLQALHRELTPQFDTLRPKDLPSLLA